MLHRIGEGVQKLIFCIIQDTCSNEHRVCPMPLYKVGLS